MVNPIKTMFAWQRTFQQGEIWAETATVRRPGDRGGAEGRIKMVALGKARVVETWGKC